MKARIMIASIIFATSMTISVFAGEWKQDANGWWYQNDDGSYPTMNNVEIDGYWYFFNKDGYMVTDTLTMGHGWIDTAGHENFDTSSLDIESDRCKIHFTGYRMFKTGDGKVVMTVEFDYTNKNAKPESVFMVDDKIQAFVKGVEVERTYRDYGDESLTNEWKDILPGATIHAAKGWYLNSPYDDAVIRACIYNNDYSEVPVKQFNIKNSQIIY